MMHSQVIQATMWLKLSSKTLTNSLCHDVESWKKGQILSLSGQSKVVRFETKTGKKILRKQHF